jgi:phosphohistidine phosphatase
MKLYLLRHGKADWPDWKQADDERPLTDQGIEEMRLVGVALKRLKVAPEFIFSSPLPRASRTAKIAAGELGVRVDERPELRPGFSRANCDRLLAKHGHADVMLVGHEPDFSELIRSLTGARVKLPKAGVAAIELGDDLAEPRLLWLLPAKAMIRLSR